MSRRPSVTEINAMKRDQLQKCLKELIKDLDEEKQVKHPNPLGDEDAATITQLLTSVLAEVKELRKEKRDLGQEVAKLKQENAALLNDVKALKSDKIFITEAVHQHQRFLEAIDGEKRAQNLIITGIPEETPLSDGTEEAEDATTDDEKVSMVLKQIGHEEDVQVIEVSRLGKRRQGPESRPRPLKVVTENPAQRKRVITDAKKLKEAADCFKSIYIKKDVHPIVRRELNRIRQVERDEKRKAENQGRDVRYDYETRCLLVDGIVVDRFKPAFF